LEEIIETGMVLCLFHKKLKKIHKKFKKFKKRPVPPLGGFAEFGGFSNPRNNIILELFESFNF
jgi:hypothetical protein